MNPKNKIIRDYIYDFIYLNKIDKLDQYLSPKDKISISMILNINIELMNREMQI